MTKRKPQMLSVFVKMPEEMIDHIKQLVEKTRQDMPGVHITASDVIRASILSAWGNEQ